MRLASCHFKVKTSPVAIVPISVFDPSQSLVQGKNIKNTSVYSREVHLIPFLPSLSMVILQTYCSLVSSADELKEKLYRI